MPKTWKPIAAYFALTILFLALVPILSVATGLTMDFDAAGKSATEKTGIEQTSNLLTVFRLAMAEPALWLLVLGSSVPALAALAVCAWTRIPSPLSMLARVRPIRDGVPVGSALRAYAMILILLPLCALISFGLRQVVPGGVEYVQPEGLLGPGLVVALFVAAFLDQGGVLEEIGWRGYAQPALQAHLVSPLRAAIIVGLAWGLWHVPRDVVGGVIGRLGFMQYLGLYLPSFVLGTVVVSIVIAYFMNRTGGSMLPAIMVHGLVNDAPGISGFAGIGTALTPYHQLTNAAPFLLLSAVLVVVYGAELGRHASESEESSK